MTQARIFLHQNLMSYGTATLTLQAEGGRLRPKVTAEILRRWRFDAGLDAAVEAG